MGRRFELDRELNHISAAWMSWLCAEAQTVGYQIRTEGLFFQSPFSISHHLFLFSQSLLARFCLSVLLCFFLSLQLSSRPSSFSPPLFGDEVTRVSRLRNQCGGLFRQPGKCSISFFCYFIWVTHLCTSPLECEIAGVRRAELAGGFRCRWQGSHVLLKTVHQPCYGSLQDRRVKFPISHPTNSNLSGFIRTGVWYPCM